MKLILALMTAAMMTGCSSTQLRTGCMFDCAKWEQWEKEAKEANAKSESEWKARKALIDAEINDRNAKRVAEAKAAEQEAKRLDAKCAGLSTQPRAMTAQDTATMEKAVKDILKDPWSAHFRNTTKVSVWRECRYGTAYEGQVNAKNSYGGYGGFKNFTVSNKGEAYLFSF